MHRNAETKRNLRWPAWIVLLACAALACRGTQAPDPTDVETKDAREPTDAEVADTEWDPGAGDTPADTRKPVFTHTVFTHDEAAGKQGLTTGSFEIPALPYPAVPVDPAYVHVLNFMLTPFAPPYRKALATHGPLILFTDSLDVLVFSPMDHFFASYVNFYGNAIHYGLNGEVDTLPPGFNHRFILVSGHGINATVHEWGRLLLADRGKQPVPAFADTGLSYLSYWTDNGAAYYYQTAEGMNEEDSLLAVKQEADQLGIPYGSFQIDSWWYFKETDAGLWPPAGLVLWEPQPEKFPSGLAAFHDALGLPLIAHNRWFATDNAYVDDYAFVIEENMALPLHQDAFDLLMENAASWGIETYEQDWLITQYWGLEYLRRDPSHAPAWMQHLDDAASQHGRTMQLCMPGAAHLMDSVDRASITTTRTSTDYKAAISKESYWPEFHTVNVLAAALGLWPFKDNFRSAEKHGQAEALISALSGGMVGIGDGLGETVPEIVMRTCRQDGRLLKPDRAATPVDRMFLPHQRPYIVSTQSEIPGLGTAYYLAAFHLAAEHPERTDDDRVWAMMQYDAKDMNDIFVFPDQVTDWSVDLAQDLGLQGQWVLYDWRNATATQVSSAFDLPAAEHLYDFSYVVLAPVQDNGLALIGSVDKYVTLASSRFLEGQVKDDALALTLAGAAGEVVNVTLFDTLTSTLLPPFQAEVGAADTVIVTAGRGR